MIAETEIRLPADAYDDATECTNRLAHRLGVAAGAITHHAGLRRSPRARKGTPGCVVRGRAGGHRPLPADPGPPPAPRDGRGAPPAAGGGATGLPQVVQALRATIVECGGEVHFGTRVTDLALASGGVTGVVTAAGDHVAGRGVILATGHSARDVLALLQRRGLALEAKPFAVGVRVEHPQALVDEIQYRCTTRPRGVPAASYALVRQVDGRGVFSFCMCPGGVICPAATSGDEVVVNGWSPSSRGLGFANAGMVVEVTPDDLAPHRTEGVLAGIAFQTALEHGAFVAGGGGLVAPAQRLVDFVEGRAPSDLPRCSYRPGIHPVNLHELLPPPLGERLRPGFRAFGRTMHGYLTNEAVGGGGETPHPSPGRIPRDPTSRMHPQASGLFPCGEGAGYAGGIMSAALDGQRTATALADAGVASR